MTPHHFVKRTGQTLAGNSPPPDLLRPKYGRAAELGLVEILMGDQGFPIWRSAQCRTASARRTVLRCSAGVTGPENPG